MSKYYLRIRPAIWYFSFFVFIVIGFAVLTFIHIRDHTWDSYDFSLKVLSDEILEEINVFKFSHGLTVNDRIAWTPQLQLEFQKSVGQEFVDETIDAQLKARGQLRITSLVDGQVLYESPQIRETELNYVDWSDAKWGYQPFHHAYQDVSHAGIGFRDIRLNRHYFVGTIFNKIPYEDVIANLNDYKKITRKVFTSLKRQGMLLYTDVDDDLIQLLSENHVLAYIYFIDNDSLAYASEAVDPNSLYVPSAAFDKSFYGNIKDSQGKRYRQYSTVIDRQPDFGYKIDIAMPSGYIYRSIIITGLLICGGALLIILVAGFGGKSLRRKAIQRVDQIINIVDELSTRNIEKPIPINGVDKSTARLIATFNHLLDRLANAFKQQKAFIADTSHELRTPLSILSFDIAEALKKVDSNSTTAEHLKEANREIGHLARIVNDLQWLAKNDAGQLYIDKRNIRLDEVLMETLSRSQRYAVKNQVNLKIGDMDVVEFYGDDKLLVHAYSNLVNNAIKFSKKGGKVRLSLINHNANIFLRVEDNGIGIPADSLENIFDRFYRVDTSRSRATGGSGLGLSIAKQIAELHSGDVWVTSNIGKGSVFSIELPQNSTESH